MTEETFEKILDDISHMTKEEYNKLLEESKKMREDYEKEVELFTSMIEPKGVMTSEDIGSLFSD